MFPSKRIRCLLILFYLTILEGGAQSFSERGVPNVLKYSVLLEPSISEKFIKGKVTIHFLLDGNVGEVAFNSGDLIIDAVKGQHVNSFRKEEQYLLIELDEGETEYEVAISYHGNPGRGVNFFPEVHQMHSAFHTSEWMVCNDNPGDKASIKLDLIVPDTLTVIANGMLKNKKELDNDKVMYSFTHDSGLPSYTFGFALGLFNSSADKAGDVVLKYFSQKYTPKELSIIFRETEAMLNFFVEKSGVPYYEGSYSQVIGHGWVSQEMGGFALLRDSYGKQVLDDETQINLAAHELAHQWWGNKVTCQDWNHFWLNEGLAVYMSSAFKEHRFGRDAYLEDIKAYFDAYKKVIDKGMDKPLVFNEWINPTQEDRAIVYYKGAYVLHLLRKQLGDDAFWKGVRNYTQLNYGKTVASKDFQVAMEESAKANLDDFFDKWVYGSE